MIQRVAFAILAGVLAFIAAIVVGVIAGKFEVEIGNTIKGLAGIIGLLVGVIYFFVGSRNRV